LKQKRNKEGAIRRKGLAEVGEELMRRGIAWDIREMNEGSDDNK
jgi:hypothetical protein